MPLSQKLVKKTIFTGDFSNFNMSKEIGKGNKHENSKHEMMRSYV